MNATEPQTLLDYWLIVYRHRYIVLLTVVTAFLTALVGSLFLPRIYEGVEEFYVSESPAATTYFTPDGSGGASREPPLPVILQEREKSFQGILESYTILQRVNKAVPEKPLDDLTKDVDIMATRNHVLRVRVRDRSPVLAARVANAYAAALNNFFMSTSAQRQEQSSTNMVNQISDTKAKLARASANLQNFLARIGTANLDREIQETMRRKADMQADLEQTQIRLKAIDSRIVSARERQLSTKLDDYYVDRAAMRVEAKAKTQAVDELTRRAEQLASQQRQEEDYHAEVDRLQKDLQNLTSSYEEARAQVASREDQVVVVKDAQVPKKPVLPLPAMNALIGAILGVIGGMYLAFFYDYLLRIDVTRQGA